MKFSILIALVSLSNYTRCCALIHPTNSKQQASRRVVLASTFSAGACILLNQQEAKADILSTTTSSSALLLAPLVKGSPYEVFNMLLKSNKLQSVAIQSDGVCLQCTDKTGNSWVFKNIPDDPNLLGELYRQDIEVTLDESHWEKKMSAVNWVRYRILGQELTYDELYEYNGYKTYRQNFPEDRAYIPSNLIAGF